MATYYVDCGMGCTLINASDSDKAEAFAQSLFGLLNGPYWVREATDEDLAWVEAMGGRIHTAN